MRAARRVQRATAVELLCDEQPLCSAPGRKSGGGMLQLLKMIV